MAKIPLGDFGTRVAQVGTTPTAQVDNQVGNAGQRVSSTGLQLAETQINQDLAQQRLEERQAAARDRQVQTIKADTAVQTGLADTFDTINADVMSGKLDRIGALAAWKDQAKTVVDDNTQGLHSEGGPLVQAQAVGTQAKLQNRLFDTFRLRERQDTAGTIASTEVELEKLWTVDPAGAMDRNKMLYRALGPAAGLTEEQIVKRTQEGVQRGTAIVVSAEAARLQQANDADGLDKLNARIDGPEGAMLDPNKKTQLSNQIFGWSESIKAKRQVAADKAERQGEKQYNLGVTELGKAQDLVVGGAFLSPDAITQLTGATAGTGLEPQVQRLLAGQQEGARFANLPVQERQATIERLRAKRSNPAVGIDSQDAQQLNRFEQVDGKLRQRVDDGDAWAAYGDAGGQTYPAMQVNNPQQLVGVFQQRMKDIADVEVWAGKKLSPLQPQEAEVMQKMLRALKPDQAATLLGQIGDVVGDADRVSAISKQIGDKDKVLGMAMLFANAKTSFGRNTSELILQGDQAIRDKTVKPDGMVETGWRANIAKQIRGAYSNQEVETNLIEAAFRISAATNGDVDRSVRLATGGIVERNGGRIPLPYGIDESGFEKRIAAMTPANFAAQVPDGKVVVGGATVPLADFVKSLPDARLVHAGQGVYNVRAGNTLVTNERGQRINVRIQP